MKATGTRRARHKKPTIIKAEQTEADDERNGGKSRMEEVKVTKARKVPSRSQDQTQKPVHSVEAAEGEDETQKQKKSTRPSRTTGGKKQPTKTKVTVPPDVEVAIEKFVEHVKESGMVGLQKEFAENKAYVPPEYVFEAFLKNKEKNRFPDVVCLDATRVVLKSDYGNYTAADGDYVNANWVVLEHVERKYIAAQGPLPNTIEDFWRMAFQESVAVIVVMCKFVENEQQKCAEYWPLKQGEYKNYGKMFVNNKKVDAEDKFDTYTLEILPDGCSNSIVIKLVHCTSWPDHGVPTSGRMVLRMLKMVKESQPGPVIVHCSAGIGRTGTILAIEAIISRIFKGKEAMVKDAFIQLRNCRASCIQTEQQYLFVYSTVLDYIKAKLPQKYSSVVAKFYQDLEKL